MRYYCTQCGAENVRAKKRSNYGCIMSLIDLIIFLGAIAFLCIGLWPLSLILFLMNIAIMFCVRKTRLCPKCKNENCLVPMNSPTARAALDK